MLLALLTAPLADAPTDCGEPTPTVPDLALVDLNPGSPTYDTTMGPQDFGGQAVVVYWAHASCGVCQSHVAALQEIWDERTDWHADTQILIVNGIGLESYLPNFTSALSLPVLQDDAEAQAFTTYGASKWYVYFVDAEGRLQWLHYSLDLGGSERDRFVEDVDRLRGAE